MLVPNRKKFIHSWDEVYYLSYKSEYWINYCRKRSRASPFINRLKILLKNRDRERQVILAVRTRALIANFENRIHDEIKHTRRGIDLLLYFFTLSKECYGYSWEDVKYELQILILLLISKRRVSSAKKSIQECRNVCKRRGFDFNSSEFLNCKLEDVSQKLQHEKYQRFERRLKYLCNTSSDELLLRPNKV